MRRSIVILLLVTVTVMLVMAAPAFAKTGTKSGGYWAYSAAGEEFYASIHGHYYVFASATDSPHSGFSTTTGKCKVCHAVHGAGITTADQTAMQPSEKLLRSTAADACGFCHLGSGAFATDPYAGGGHSSVMNYNGNENNTEFPWGAADVARSGHFKTHGHDNPQGVAQPLKSYKGCVSCHAVHGANTMTEAGLKPNILKNDPAKGVIAAVGSGWGASGRGYGSKYSPTTTQAEFCEDCHDGTKVVAADGTATAIISQASFNQYFPNCGWRNDRAFPADTSGLCHNSVQTAITESVANFGAFNNKAHNGRSHIMTTTLDAGYGMATNVVTETIFATGNGCATCHDVKKYDHGIGAPLQQGATFPHFGLTPAGDPDSWDDDIPTNELITHFPDIVESDAPCMKGCHAGVGTMY